MPDRLRIALLVVLLASWARAHPGPGKSVTARECGRARVGEAAPWLAGWTLDERVVNLGHLKSEAAASKHRALLVVFFATWCEPCKPGLTLLARNLGALREAGIYPVLVDYEEEASRVKPFLEGMGLGGVKVILDRFGKTAQGYGAARSLGDDQWEASLPKTFLLDTSGVLRLIVTEEGRDYLEVLLREVRSWETPSR